MSNDRVNGEDSILEVVTEKEEDEIQVNGKPLHKLTNTEFMIYLMEYTHPLSQLMVIIALDAYTKAVINTGITPADGMISAKHWKAQAERVQELLDARQKGDERGRKRD